MWPAFTWLGWRPAVERRFGDHKAWRLRSYALAAAAITLRRMLPASAFLGLEFVAAYRAIVWLAWTANLAPVELHIRRGRASAATRPRLASA